MGTPSSASAALGGRLRTGRVFGSMMGARSLRLSIIAARLLHEHACDRFVKIARQIAAVLPCLIVPAIVVADALPLLRPASLDGWAMRSFDGETSDQSVVLDGVHALRAQADRSASALYWEGQVALSLWPSLRWRCRIQAAMSGTRERTRTGDDLAARISVVARDSLLFWKSHALCYVWASAAKAGQDWPNPYSDEVHMVALNGIGDATGDWVEHERDVAADFQRYFGVVPKEIDAVGVMTNLDQSGIWAIAWYADLRFEKN